MGSGELMLFGFSAAVKDDAEFRVFVCGLSDPSGSLMVQADSLETMKGEI